MELTFLGTGTSTGIPMIGCDCPVCRSTDPRNKRRRSCLYVKTECVAFVIDTPPDFREQMLDADIRRLDAVVFTHAHADHVFGFDDVRRFNTLAGDVVLPAYGVPETLARIQRIFSYIKTTPNNLGLFRPLIEFRPVTGPFEIGDVRLTPFEVEHGEKMTGYLLESGGARVGYVCDCHRIPEHSLAQLTDLDVMILDALRPEPPHPTHLCLSESLALLARIGAKQSYLIHMGHGFDHATLVRNLPPGIAPSYDGLRIRVERTEKRSA
ncbi:MAG: MBL fold metallo-hydrolase [Kiritimatiellae bacterium]|nr:MBL fold metallo-hydrolase [Kiritimatiellia bacterium]